MMKARRDTKKNERKKERKNKRIVLTKTETNKEKGTGLCLLLCKEMVTKNGGEIVVKSTVNEGSTFYFTMPKEPINTN